MKCPTLRPLWCLVLAAATLLAAAADGAPETFALRESRVLGRIAADDPDHHQDDVGELEALTRHRRDRRALQLLIRRPREDTDESDDSPQDRADSTPAPGGSFMETIQNQLPGQLQGLGGAMEDSKMVVGTFQAIIMPGSAATDMAQQMQGFISNMPQIPQLPGGG